MGRQSQLWYWAENVMNVLALNAGSSSLKFRLLRVDGSDSGSDSASLAGGLVEKWGTSEAMLRLEMPGKADEHRAVAAETPQQAAAEAIKACLPLGIDAIAHRVVHGGPNLTQPVRITQDVMTAIGAAERFAPLHNGLALAGMRAAMEAAPRATSVAIFDTAFHRTIPEYAGTYAIPIDLTRKHSIRRYGFHGISHQYVSGQLIKRLGRPAGGTRLITCHLGNGCSVCAVLDGKSIDTSMGMTPMEGLVMGTRCGDVDPGLMLYLMNLPDVTGKELDEMLNHRSGLAGLTGTGGDVRDIEKKASGGDAQAKLALEIFAYRARKYIGAYAVALGGIDAISFAGGIGEHSAGIRGQICAGLEFLGIVLDGRRNDGADSDQSVRLHADESKVEIWLIPADEERQMATEVFALLQEK
jgi:acetate kinase